MGSLDQYWRRPRLGALSNGNFPTNTREEREGRGGEGCVVTLGIDWAITVIDSEAIRVTNNFWRGGGGGGIVEGGQERQ